MPFAAVGDRAVLVTFDGAPPRVTVELPPHVLACIPGHESLLVVCDDAPNGDAIRVWLEDAGEGAGIHRTTHDFNIAFDGLDFEEFLARVGVARDEFLARVSDVRLTVRYLGFRPGFAYCDGWPEAWRLPRRATSRNRVPRNTFAIAGTMAGVYPDDLPGGWNLLGTTDAVLWDPTREPPNLLQPGDEIAIHPVDRVVVPPPVVVTEARDWPPLGEVIAPGQLTTIVGPRDWRLANAGVSPGGPFDAVAAALANRAVGNADDAPLLECVLVTPTLRLDRRAAFCDSSLVVREFTTAGRIPFRGYVAIEGGVGGEGVLRKGDVLRSSPECGGLPPLVEIETRAAASCRTPDIRINLGPHPAPPLPREWEVTKELNRVAIRLRPIEPVGVTLPADLPSCGMQFGTLQWHPDGSLLAMGPDHPVTGGYLQPATVLSSELWKLAQLSPGERVTLVAE